MAEKDMPAIPAIDKDKALQIAISQIEKEFGKGSIMRLGAEAAVADVPVFSTGSLSLDLALGIGGLPAGRIVEIYGPESSGKTTLCLHVIANAQAMCAEFLRRGYKVVSGGTDNHLMLIDLRTKFPELTGKVAEKVLVAADITTNKNMVPFDSRSAFQTSGIRLGTPAITTRGVKDDMMPFIAEMIETVLNAPEDEKVIATVRRKVNEVMAEYPLFAY